MKTNYKVLLLTFVINMFMALSLNSFTSPTLYLPMMFLYFLSGLAAFLDKATFYRSIHLKFEEKISFICFIICFISVCFYVADSLDFIEITFQCNNGMYKVLMQGVQNSFFTFNSINVTPIMFAFAFILPFAYLALCLIPYLREHGLTMDKIIYISKNNKLKLFGLIILSISIGFIGNGICYLKYCKSDCTYGSPQYYKYFWVFLIISLCVLYMQFFLRHKNDDSMNQPEEHTESTEYKGC